jgi:hypothetical protein
MILRYVSSTGMINGIDRTQICAIRDLNTTHEPEDVQLAEAGMTLTDISVRA